MIREVLFRGKQLDSGQWVEGDLYHRNEEVLITNYDKGFTVSVDPETIGQYTGFLDMNGKRVFEGDVCLTEPDRHNDYKRYKNVVTADNMGFAYFEVGFEDWEVFTGFGDPRAVVKFWEVIGNIHDNPELLEKENNNA